MTNKFEEDTIVYLLDQGKGTLVECVPGYYVVELTNGVEMDFSTQDKFLSKEEYEREKNRLSPMERRHANERIAAAKANPKIDNGAGFALKLYEGVAHPSYKDTQFLELLEKHKFGRFIYQYSKDNIPKFSTLENFHKVRALAEFWQVPMVVMRECSQYGLFDDMLRKMMFSNPDKFKETFMGESATAVFMADLMKAVNRTLGDEDNVTNISTVYTRG